MYLTLVCFIVVNIMLVLLNLCVTIPTYVCHLGFDAYLFHLTQDATFDPYFTRLLALWSLGESFRSLVGCGFTIDILPLFTISYLVPMYIESPKLLVGCGFGRIWEARIERTHCT